MSMLIWWMLSDKYLATDGHRWWVIIEGPGMLVKSPPICSCVGSHKEGGS